MPLSVQLQRSFVHGILHSGSTAINSWSVQHKRWDIPPGFGPCTHTHTHTRIMIAMESVVNGLHNDSRHVVWTLPGLSGFVSPRFGVNIRGDYG